MFFEKTAKDGRINIAEREVLFQGKNIFKSPQTYFILLYSFKHHILNKKVYLNYDYNMFVIFCFQDISQLFDWYLVQHIKWIEIG